MADVSKMIQNLPRLGVPFIENASRYFRLICNGLIEVVVACGQLFGEFVQYLGCSVPVDMLGLGVVRSRLDVEPRVSLAFGFRHLGEKDFLWGDAAKIARQPYSLHQPDGPLGRIEAPAADAIAVVVLEGVMEIVIPFAKREKCHKSAVAGAATARIRLSAHAMAEGVDEERGMLHDNDAGHARDEKRAQGALATVPDVPERRGQ